MKYWDYYISLFSDNDNKIVIAIWALTIALITFFLNFIIKPIYKNIIPEGADLQSVPTKSIKTHKLQR